MLSQITESFLGQLSYSVYLIILLAAIYCVRVGRDAVEKLLVENRHASQKDLVWFPNIWRKLKRRLTNRVIVIKCKFTAAISWLK